MITKYLSAAWTAVAPALGNHLWQSTLFLLVAGLLTLALQNNYARIRYALWFTASVKFLIPFSLITLIAGHWASPRPPYAPKSAVYVTIQQVSLPFSPALSVQQRAIEATRLSNMTDLLPALLSVWLFGFLVVCLWWYVRWRRISSIVRRATPASEGRELAILRKAESAMGLQLRTKLLLSPCSLEPGIFGITAPVMIWPQGISERLDDAHVEAILIHELCRLRRRDNLAAAIHMLVEALFWFYPPVWWLGSRLLDERERACDQAVLTSGRDRRTYAESILKICEFCVRSPLTAVSGVTGANLQRRIARIMAGQVGSSLDFSKKILLGGFALAVIAAPIVVGLLDATPVRTAQQAPSIATSRYVYEFASVKLNEAGTASLKTGNGVIMQGMSFTPGTFTAQNTSLQDLIRTAYSVEDYQISGLPESLTFTLYDVEGKAGKSTLDELRKLGKEQQDLENQRMLQALLMDRFKLAVHRKTTELPVYSLVVSEPGKLHEALGDCGPQPDLVAAKTDAPPPPPCGSLRVFPWVGRMDGLKVPVKGLVANLSGFTKRMVRDNTNLRGKYDMNLNWFPSPGEFPPRPAYLPSTYQPDSSSPPLLTALQQQLGLKLESQSGPVPLLVIDHVENLPAN